ncbi:protein mono-ADP-ribosyltransferase PARP9 [Pempheris klunzingeri]|uniref:protein mono-ADP-ribosyltransferase PARP9 n=1 Tax=Pempheris klunzingeri TaxID=3127111 RepID=UPI003980E80B
MASEFNIPLEGSSLNIVRRCGSTLSDVLLSRFGCVATFPGVDFESIAQQKLTTAPEKRFAATLHPGVEVSVWKADLSNFQVDAVVNAANLRLQHYGGLALALSKAGGPQIQEDSDDYIKKHGALVEGEAIVSDAGLLPCKKIIHAVGPALRKYPSKTDVSLAELQLKEAIKNILDKVKENHLRSVAIPAISSGLFNYPLPECATTIVTAVKHYCQKSSGYLPKEIQLVNHDEPTVKEMEAACHQILVPHQPATYSQAAAQSKRRGDAQTSKPTVQIGNVNLTLKRGKIEEQQTDVIVNTSFNRDLRRGQISNTMLQKAGDKMQHEMNSAPLKGFLIITKPYKLQCKEVYHTVCTEKSKDEPPKSLYRSVLQCLQNAVSNNHKSIAFPAIGTGGLGFDKKEVAKIMSRAVADFSLESPKKMEVYFIIFPSDDDIFKAFEEQIRYLQRSAPSPSFTHAPQHREDFHVSRAPSPRISVSGLSDETTREAHRWLTGLLFQSSGTVIIPNNFIQHCGEEEHQQLSQLIKKDVSIEEFFVKGHASIMVTGHSREDVVVTVLQVEAILCHIQREFVREEEHALLKMTSKYLSFGRKTVHHSNSEFHDRLSPFKRHGLRILKVDRVENSALEMLFDLKKEQLLCSSRKMFQRIPAQFCEMVGRVGFHAEFAPPYDPTYGEGIYFAGKVDVAMEVWKHPEEEYLYFVEAEVLTGNSTPGKRGLILPPAMGTQMLYDSVSGGADISVIFSGYQALPRYIITCKIT